MSVLLPGNSGPDKVAPIIVSLANSVDIYA